MQVHKVIELLKGLTLERKLISKLSEMLISKIIESEKFEFNFGEFPDACKTEAESDELVKRIKLPYPLCYFEIPNFGAILAFHPSYTSNHIKLQVFYYNTKNQWSFLDPADQLIIDLETGLFRTNSDDPKIQKLYNGNSKENDLTIMIISLIVSGISVLNCSNVITLNNEPSKKLNKKRIEKGKVPLFSYKTLHIKTPVINKEKINLGGTHNSPRLHLRRGHIRKYSTHSIWINNMIVGNPKKGIVLKEYKIT